MRGHAEKISPAGTLVMEGLGISRRPDIRILSPFSAPPCSGTTTTITLRPDFSSSVKEGVQSSSNSFCARIFALIRRFADAGKWLPCAAGGCKRKSRSGNWLHVLPRQPAVQYPPNRHIYRRAVTAGWQADCSSVRSAYRRFRELLFRKPPNSPL